MAFLRRTSFWVGVIGLVLAIISFIPGLAALIENRQPNPPELFWAAIAFIVFWITSFSVIFIQQHEVMDDIDNLSSRIDDDQKAVFTNVTSLSQWADAMTYRPDLVHREQMQDVWEKLLWKVQKRYWATNYIKPEFYKKAAHSLPLAIQEAKLLDNADIKKVFIIDDLTERNKMESVFSEQHNRGIKVKYILHSEIQGDPVLRGKASQLATEDFGIVDSRLTLLWRLKNRNVDSGQVLSDPQQANMYEDFFSALFKAAHEYPWQQKLRSLTDQDTIEINSWPQYQPPYTDLDYALRTKGWLHEYPEKEGNYRYAAINANELVGFSILTQTKPGEAEFFIAMHPTRLLKGMGNTFTRLTVEKGFNDLNLNRIHLKVRHWHHVAIHLYESVGFRRTGEAKLTVNGKDETFILMELLRH